MRMPFANAPWSGSGGGAGAACPQRRRLLAAGIGLGATAVAPGSVRAAPYIDPDADWIPAPALLDDLPRQMRAFGVPGVGIAVVEGGDVVWSHGFGVRRAGWPVPVDARTLFELASLSKPLFAWLVLRLVDLGQIDLDRPLVDWRRPPYLGHHPWAERITARDVLRHSSGLPNWREAPDREPLLPAVEPGTRIDYSGEGFFWLQLVVETITGESLDATAQRLLFQPAGMRDSSFAWSPALGERSVHGHAAPDADDQGPAQVLREQFEAAQPVALAWGKPLADWRWDDAVRALPIVQALARPGLVHWAGDIMANAAASLRASAVDYARFLALMVRTPRADWELAPPTRALMLTPQIRVPGRWTEKALGWNLEATARGPVFYHSGSNSGIFKNFAIGDAARQRALVVATNGALGNLLHRRIVRACTGLDLLAFDV